MGAALERDGFRGIQLWQKFREIEDPRAQRNGEGWGLGSRWMLDLIDLMTNYPLVNVYITIENHHF